ncbi:MAG TPA: ATPase [Candidatus Margulisbacteria bacterium]|nr:MAG: ATPase [Candidatus Margulisbacteria bacterium GWD2_39_127]OGI05285.1 MAG: ATPase [Candidatus Margulisbacteria bacterium GWF2_38_17]HAR64279.1 ATPase [Candidatus Margulisiibacteriota bacterium]
MKPPDYLDLSGITEKDAQERSQNEGYNELPSSKQRSVIAITLEVFREPMFILLVTGGIIYFLLGEPQEALLLLSFVFVVMGITIYQERKTEHALEALKELSSPRALVIRCGIQKRIAGREIVREDIMILKEGDRVAADAIVLQETNLLIDESLLTGESVPVRKSAWNGVALTVAPGGDDLPFVYSGSLIIQGQGIAKVTATGTNTEIGKIGKTLESLKPEPTPLQQETGDLVKKIALIGFFLFLIIVFTYGLVRNDWLNGLLAGITLAMAILPEEFPVVLTIFLALGAWRMSRKNVLTRKITAIETLGSATVLCVDKTGTLTLNRMRIKKIFANNDFYDLEMKRNESLPEQFHELVEYSILASQKDPFDPMEKAIKKLGEYKLSNTPHIHYDWNLIHEYPLSKSLLAMSHVWQSPNGQDYIIASKGAPEAILDLCHLSPSQIDDLSKKISMLANEGLRVIAVAKASFRKEQLPSQQHAFNFLFLGLIGLEDPIRSSVPEALDECYRAGIRIIMITGDYPATAQNIARQIKLQQATEVITGHELTTMNDSELQNRIKSIGICARVVPEQKLRIVNALKANGEIVAMTGDGINDAPALKASNIGIAMGGRGTDVAREAASLVLLDDDFSSIVAAIRMGRRIFDNLQKAMAYIVSIHIPIAGMSLIPVLVNWPLVLLPVHIAFLQLIIDPTCSIVFEAEPEEKNIMDRPPRKQHEHLFNRNVLVISLLQGLSVLFIILTIFFFSLNSGRGASEARAMTFTTLIIANLGLILTNRSWLTTIPSSLASHNRALGWVLGGAVLFLALVLYVPFLRGLFRFKILHPNDLFICFSAGIISIIWFEFLKTIKNREKKTSLLL